MARKLIKRGAEASLYDTKGTGSLGAEKVVEKLRLPKRYRAKVLDDRIRDERLKTEAKLMAEARALGIPVPIIFDIDLAEKKLVLERLGGRMVKDVLNSNYKAKHALCRKVGRHVGILHKNDIIHGDLTTSNMILDGDRLYFIDFSMGAKSRELEAKGVDLHLLAEAFKSSHPREPKLFESALKGYKNANPKAKEVIEKMMEIEKRGRYT